MRIYYLILIAFLIIFSGCEKRGAKSSLTVPQGVGGENNSSKNEGEKQNSGEPDNGSFSKSLVSMIERLADEIFYLKKEQERIKRKAINSAIKDLNLLKNIVLNSYKINEYKKLFFDIDEKQVEELISFFKELPDHGIDTDNYFLEKIEKSFDELKNSKVQTHEKIHKQMNPKYYELLKKLLIFSKTPDENEIKGVILDLEINDSFVDKEPEIKEFFKKYFDIYADYYKKKAVLDVYLLNAFFMYCLDFKYIIKAHPYKGSIEPYKGINRFEKQLHEDAENINKDVLSYMKGLMPALPLYQKTIKAYKYYQKLAQEGKIKKIRIPLNLRKGIKSKAVEKLKKRLSLEGYYFGKIDKIFDEKLRQAVLLYQETHQLPRTGKIDKLTLKSLNKPMSFRVKELKLSLQRYRESEIPKDLKYFFRINIPQFELEIWKDGKIIEKHKVVVGNTKIEINNEKLIIGPFNYTQFINSKITNIVINPKWRVPNRITQDELELKLINEPDYFEKNNYSVVISPDGAELITQGEGDDNALGRVKFNFPNPYSIFMHDTPEKQFFKRIFRAFSHGCIRLDKAVDLARKILKQQLGITDEKFNKILDDLKEKGFNLKYKIPIFVEYNTVTINEAGRPVFLIDIYHYDWAYFNQLIPYIQKLKLKEKEFLKVKRLMKKWKGISRSYYEKLMKKKIYEERRKRKKKKQ